MAVTLSRHPTHAAHLRSSVLDTTVDKLTLRSNVQLVANALARVRPLPDTDRRESCRLTDVRDVRGMREACASRLSSRAVGAA
eukprot:3751686-Rhodomonas_salina.1